MPEISSTQSVSVVMCTYNGEAFLREQLMSIICQTYPILEIVIVDDGSTDGTREIIESIASSNPKIALHKNNVNLGYNKNFEKALCLATGNVIAISDQDDVWDKRKVETMLNSWADDTLLIYCSSIKFKIKVPGNPQPNKFIKPIAGINPKKLAIRNTVSGHTMLLKKQLLHIALPFNSDVYYDWWLAIVATCNGGISHVPTILVYQRDHENNETLKKGLSSNDRFSDYKKMLVPHLLKFQAIPNLKKEDNEFFRTLYYLWNQSITGKRKLQLFSFLVRYRSDLFDYKIRRFPLISQVKHSFRYSFKQSRSD